jgi:hypothetical protein
MFVTHLRSWIQPVMCLSTLSNDLPLSGFALEEKLVVLVAPFSGRFSGLKPVNLHLLLFGIISDDLQVHKLVYITLFLRLLEKTFFF